MPGPDDLIALATPMLEGKPTRVLPMPGGGSRRHFYRLEGSRGSVVGVIGEDLDEVRAFLAFTAHLAGKGIPVPALLAEDAPRGLYVMEDLGGPTLAERLAGWRAEWRAERRAERRALPDGEARANRALETSVLETVVRWLPVIQVRGGEGFEALEASLPPGARALDGQVFRGDLERFRAHYLPRYAPAAPPLDAALQGDLEALLARLEAIPRQHFCYRDFQTRNIMWVERAGGAGPVFLDYQSGRRGALAYDLTSLLHSPETGADEALRGRLIDVYLEALAECGVVLTKAAFLADFYPVVLIRRLQALGAYADLGHARGKPAYLERIPPARADLRAMLAAGRFNFGLPALERWLAGVLRV